MKVTPGLLLRATGLAPDVIAGLALAIAGIASIGVAEILARRSPGQRIGRTLAAARDVSIDEAVRIAESGEQRYVRVHGRISSDEEFPDEHDRPLVFRRKRIDLRKPDGRWQTSSSETEGVPFGIEIPRQLHHCRRRRTGRGPGRGAAPGRRRRRRPAAGDDRIDRSADTGAPRDRAGVGRRACQRRWSARARAPTARRRCRADWAGR